MSVSTGDAVGIAGLVRNPDFRLLKKTFEIKREQIERRIVSDCLHGGEDASPVDQRKIDYFRGFLAGAQALLENPAEMERRLEKMMRSTDASGQPRTRR